MKNEIIKIDENIFQCCDCGAYADKIIKLRLFNSKDLDSEIIEMVNNDFENLLL